VGQSSALSYEEELHDLTPMVDVVLFLLIFFLVTSVQALQAVIDMPTPQAVGAASKGRSISEYEQDPDFISVRIEDDDSIWVEDEQTFADQDLRVKLRAAAAERPRAPSVVVIGNAEASHGAAVRVFDACAYARVKDVSFVVQEGEAR
jgi:biopolymer transport protein ExbD